MPNPSKPFVCPRCLYETPLKKRIKRHFEESKKPCVNRSGIELVPEIKEYVYTNYVYRKEDSKEDCAAQENTVKQEMSVKPNINQVINMHNTYQNILGNMDCADKINLFLTYRNERQIDFEDKLELDFQSRVEKLENNDYPTGFYLNTEGLLNMIDGATKMNSDKVESFNILFDRTVNRVRLFSCGQWDSFIEEFGIKEVVKLIKSYFFDTYETYLIKNIKGNNTKINRFTLQEHLDIYYYFLACFDFTPYILSLDDKEIVNYYPKENHNSISQHYYKCYLEIKQGLKVSEKNRMLKQVTKIIKENSSHNTNLLNKIMLELLKVDNCFLQELLRNQKIE